MTAEPEVRLLRYFVAVAEDLHFGRAATRLFITQSALSQQIRKLEVDLGLVLFERDRRGVALTPGGRALIEPATRVVAASEQFAADAQRLRRTPQPVERLVLGFQVQLPGRGLSRVVRRHLDRYPGIAVDPRQFDFSDTSAGLVAGTSDVAVLSLPVTHRLHTEPLFSERVVALVPSGHPLALRVSVTVEDLVDSGLPWAQPLDADPVWRDYWTAAVQRAALGPRGQIRTESPPNVESYLMQVSSAQLIGLTFEALASSYSLDEIATVSVDDVAPAQFAAARRPHDNRETVLALMDTLHDVLGDRSRTANDGRLSSG